MKNTLRHTFIFIVFLSIICVFIGLNVSVKAYSNEDNLNLEGKIVELFGEKTILNADYLYNFDDEEIFIYSEFLGRFNDNYFMVFVHIKDSNKN